ncbi:MAG: PQQ-like beta-propeller repeat protein [Chloroflexi bacterium]|nr:PQQ-like beta-propeller repeat protein [Chloroflexota bacterium]
MSGYRKLSRLGTLILSIGFSILALSTTWSPLQGEHAAQTSAWPMFHRDAQHSARAAVASPAQDTIAWSVTITGLVSSSPVIGPDQTIYFGSWNGLLYAVNPATHNVKWSFDPHGEISSTPAVGPDGTVYFGTWQNSVYAVNPDGTRRWHFSTGAADTDSWVSSSPTLSPDGLTVYIGSYNDKLYALDAGSGAPRWTFTTGGDITGSPALSPDGQVVYIGSWDKQLYAIRAADGITASVPYSTGNFIPASPVVASDGAIYVPDGGGILHVLNIDLTVRGKFQTVSYMRSTPSLGAQGNVYVLASYSDETREALYAFGGVTRTLDLGTSLNYFGDEFSPSPAIGADGIVYIGSQSGSFYALNSDLTVRWQVPLDGGVEASPAIAADGTVYIITYEGTLYAFSPLRLIYLPFASKGYRR